MMVKQKKQLRNEAEWKDIRIKRTTAKLLMQVKIDNDLLTYDDAIQVVLNRLKMLQ